MNFTTNNENKIFNPITKRWIINNSKNRSSITRQIEKSNILITPPLTDEPIKKMKICFFSGFNFEFQYTNFNIQVLIDTLRKEKNDNENISYKFYKEGIEEEDELINIDENIKYYAMEYTKISDKFTVGLFRNEKGNEDGMGKFDQWVYKNTWRITKINNKSITVRELDNNRRWGRPKQLKLRRDEDGVLYFNNKYGYSGSFHYNQYAKDLIKKEENEIEQRED